eukprot:12526113-Ditylum_brightwellii.AAC.1
MVSFSKPLEVVEPQGNSPQELKPIIPIEHPKVHKLTKGNCHMYKLCTVPYNANLPTHDLGSFFSTPDLRRSVQSFRKTYKP